MNAVFDIKNTIPATTKTTRGAGLFKVIVKNPPKMAKLKKKKYVKIAPK